MKGSVEKVCRGSLFSIATLYHGLDGSLSPKALASHQRDAVQTSQQL